MKKREWGWLRRRAGKRANPNKHMTSERIDTDRAVTLQRTAQDEGDLFIWTIYNSPRDLPGRYVARPFSARHEAAPLPYHLEAATLRDIRAQLPRGLHCLMRDVADDPSIVESWL